MAQPAESDRVELSRVFQGRLITVGAIAYIVSPLRDPSFNPANSLEPLNAGATIDFLRPERYWVSATQTLAVLISTNIVALIWLRFFRRYITARANSLLISLGTLGLFGIWFVVAGCLWFGSLFFLLQQYIVD
ncbi:MAG: hypothetical protein ACFB0D_24985 [Phormidesmis sp.]|mgnify:CR=1 FL=1